MIKSFRFISLKKIIVFKLNPQVQVQSCLKQANVQIQKWTPGLFNFRPENTEIKYVLFWFAHYLNLFGSKCYSSYQLVVEGEVVSSLVCVPALSLWSFMKKDDVQIKGVYTKPEYRGKGFGYKLLEYVRNDLNVQKQSVWYLTHDQNFSSIKLCEKVGFQFVGYYHANSKYWFMRRGTIEESVN